MYIETYETLLNTLDGKQVLGESFYYLGLMLIFLDNLIPGPVRERIVICHLRIVGGQSGITNLHHLCKLCKKTGFLPKWYPNQEKKNWMINVAQISSKNPSEPICFTQYLFERMEVDSKSQPKNLTLRKICNKTNPGNKRQRHLRSS